jgi:hypothetical protein
MAGPPVQDVDHGWEDLKQVLENLKSGEAYVKVGILGDEAAKVAPEHQHGAAGAAAAEPLTNVKLALIHEFGAPEAGIPERSFIRVPFDLGQSANTAKLSKLVKSVYGGKLTIRKALEVMGFAVKWDIKNFVIRGQVTPPDSEATIRKKTEKGAWNKASKGSPVTLIDTKVMVNTVDFAVVLSRTNQSNADGEA